MGLKAKLNKKELSIGSWISIPHPSVVEVMATAGFEWLVIDMEHTVTDLETALNLIITIQSKKMKALVRVPANEEVIIKKILDAGADGVIVPMVKNKEEAQRAVSFAKYPPVGTRGVGLFRAQGYGTSFDSYIEKVKTEIPVIIQIEHIEAVNNLEDILSTKGIDAIMVGPYDLSASMGKPGRYEEEDVVEALDRVIKVTKASNVSLGFHVIPSRAEDILKKVKEDYTFLAFSIDFFFLGDRAREEMSKLREKLGN